MAPTPQPGIVIQMMEASQTCRELMGLMLEENDNLQHQNLAHTEARLLMKKRLALRLEKLLVDIKAHKNDLRGNRNVENMAVKLAEEIDVFRTIASKNEVMLRAAHKLRADIVEMIRDTLEAQQPRVTTYNAGGYVQHGTGGTRVVAAVV